MPPAANAAGSASSATSTMSVPNAMPKIANVARRGPRRSARWKVRSRYGHSRKPSTSDGSSHQTSIAASSGANAATSRSAAGGWARHAQTSAIAENTQAPAAIHAMTRSRVAATASPTSTTASMPSPAPAYPPAAGPSATLPVQPASSS